MLGRPAEGPVAGHFSCAVRPHAAAPFAALVRACTNNFSILDTDDQMRLLKQVMEGFRLDAKRWPLRRLLMAAIQRFKDRGQTPARHHAVRRCGRSGGRPGMQEVFGAYQAAAGGS